MNVKATAQVAVLVTRSGKSGEQLSQSLNEQGFKSWFTPTINIIKESLLLPAEDFQQAIFVSPNAVKYSVERSQLVKDVLPTQLIAVGKGTATRLEQNGYSDVLIPESSNTEGLLELPTLQSIKGQQILLIKGQGGRELLEQKLSERGAICYPLEVYSRIQKQIDEKSWHDFLAASQDKSNSTEKKKLNIITLASIDALEALKAKLLNDNIVELLTFVVASDRIAKKVAEYNVKEIVIADSAANESTMRSIKKLTMRAKND